MRSKLFLSSKQKRGLKTIIQNKTFGIRNVNDLATHIGVSYAQLSNSLSGGTPCTEAVYEAITKFLEEQGVKP